MRFAWNIIGLDRSMNKSQFSNKFQSSIGMGMDNPVTGLTIKQLQPDYCNFDLQIE